MYSLDRFKVLSVGKAFAIVGLVGGIFGGLWVFLTFSNVACMQVDVQPYQTSGLTLAPDYCSTPGLATRLLVLFIAWLACIALAFVMGIIYAALYNWLSEYFGKIKVRLNLNQKGAYEITHFQVWSVVKNLAIIWLIVGLIVNVLVIIFSINFFGAFLSFGSSNVFYESSLFAFLIGWLGSAIAFVGLTALITWLYNLLSRFVGHITIHLGVKS
ncbi:MAG: hypothetical protein WCT08_03430 [Patescibacteria group bacterium]|jgi:hypothetical protein